MLCSCFVADLRGKFNVFVHFPARQLLNSHSRSDMAPGIEIIWSIPDFPQYVSKRICSTPCFHKSGLEVGKRLSRRHSC